MNFLFPLGLLGLIGVPILILIYIIKSKYSEQTVSSTYLWTLSERFLKRKRPVSPITGIISLVLQVLAVTVISLIIAHPVITIPDSAKEYCFIIDASGSMNMEADGETRFDRAKDAIEKLIDSSTDGSRYSLVSVSDVTVTVYDQITDKKQATRLLNELKVGFADPENTDAIGIAQAYFNENAGVKTYLITDTSYEKTENITLINVAKYEKNIGISDITWSLSGGVLTVNGNVDSYGYDKDVEISLFVDRGETASAKATVAVSAGESSQFSLTATLKSFTSLKLTANTNDDMRVDDEYIIYNIKSESTYSILLVSDTPFFMETVLGAVGYDKITVKTQDEYSSSDRGYGLYIFDCCSPKEIPTDGAVWFIDPQGSVPDSGFSVQGEVELSRGERLDITSSSSSISKKLVAGVEGNEIYITEYVKCSLYRGFTTLFSYKGNPLIFAGSNNVGHREVVIAFDLHDSNLPMLVDYVVLVKNLMTYSFPDIVETTNYYAGQEAVVNVVSNCESIRVEAPSGEITYLSTDSATSSFVLAETGSYKLTVTVSDIPREYYIYSSLPKAERDPAPAADGIAIQGEADEGGFDGTFDPLIILFISLAVLFLADWMVYCYEKYQLR